MLTIVTFRFAPWLGPEVAGLISQPSGTSLRSAPSETLNAMPMRVSTLLPEIFSWANAGEARSTKASDSMVGMVFLLWLSSLTKSFLVHDRCQRVLVDHDVDDRRQVALKRALQRGRERRRVADALAVRAEDARKRGEVDVAVIDTEEPSAVELLLESALVAEPAIVVHHAYHRDALAHRGLELTDVAHHAHVANR